MGSLLLGQLKHRWVESAAVALMIAVVVAALIAHRSVVRSAESTVHELAHKLGDNMLLLPETMDLMGFYGFRYGSETLPPDAREAIRSSDVAEHVGFMRSRLYSNVTVRGVEVVLIGEQTDRPAGSKGGVYPAVVGREAARRLGLQAGDELPIGDVRLRVLRVVDVADGEFDDAMLTTLSAAQLVTGRPGERA
jgi:predicted lysophospholipase L1 biosynthesis ABC-type transport system permease subunit